MKDAQIIEEEDKTKLYDLVAELRQLPDDLPPPEEVDDPDDHPLLKLMVEKGEWFVRLWPIIQSIVQTRIASYDSPSDFEEGSSHSDFIPWGEKLTNIDGEISRLSNKDVKIRRKAVRLLFEENNPRALTGFVKLLEDSDFWFRN